jgi:hypothetical protein
MVSGGYSSKVDPQHADEPTALVGLAADSIREVALVIGGQRTVIPVINNAFYAELGTSVATWDVQLEVTYPNGETKTVAIPDSRG